VCDKCMAPDEREVIEANPLEAVGPEVVAEFLMHMQDHPELWR
jgi:hypothetical protein